MNSELLGVVLALLASVSFESSYVLLTRESRMVGRCGQPGGRFLVSLLHRPQWLLAISIDGAGIVLELFALREASLIVVQPVMSVGLIGLVFAAHVFLGERIDRGTSGRTRFVPQPPSNATVRRSASCALPIPGKAAVPLDVV
jgi:hypothetical protein